jgi:hypothetical protein
MIDFKKLGAKAAAEGKDMTKPVVGGGGDYEPPAAGPCRLRFVAYIEIGKQKEKFMGKDRVREKALLVFEVSGPKHPPTVLDDGTKIPHRITIKETVSLNEKANFFKLFTRMNYAGKAVHMAQLLGEAFKGEIIHRKFAKKGEDKANPATWTGVIADLKSKDKGFTIEPPRYEVVNEDGPTGEFKMLPVEPAISPIKGFLWDHADMEQWNGIFLDGKYDDRKDEKTGEITPGKSKNTLQAQIMQAVNFKGSPIEALLKQGGAKIDIPDTDDHDVTADIDDEPVAPAMDKVTPQGEAATDALNGIV